MRQRYVLDAWAVLALLWAEEPAASRVRQLLRDAQDQACELFMSLINLGEVYYRVARTHGEAEAQATLARLYHLDVEYLAASEESIFSAARLKARFSLSYADAFAASSAQSLRATLVTGDPELVKLGEWLSLERLHRHQA